jgi:hypothetical protein
MCFFAHAFAQALEGDLGSEFLVLVSMYGKILLAHSP